jgi:hypothetical protein
VFIEIVCRAASFAFANLRLHKFPDELRVTRELQNSVATAMEDPCLTGDGFARVGLGCASGRSKSWRPSWWR